MSNKMRHDIQECSQITPVLYGIETQRIVGGRREMSKRLLASKNLLCGGICRIREARWLPQGEQAPQYTLYTLFCTRRGEIEAQESMRNIFWQCGVWITMRLSVQTFCPYIAQRTRKELNVNSGEFS